VDGFNKSRKKRRRKTTLPKKKRPEKRLNGEKVDQGGSTARKKDPRAKKKETGCSRGDFRTSEQSIWTKEKAGGEKHRSTKNQRPGWTSRIVYGPKKGAGKE